MTYEERFVETTNNQETISIRLLFSAVRTLLLKIFVVILCREITFLLRLFKNISTFEFLVHYRLYTFWSGTYRCIVITCNVISVREYDFVTSVIYKQSKQTKTNSSFQQSDKNLFLLMCRHSRSRSHKIKSCFFFKYVQSPSQVSNVPVVSMSEN